ncbi:MAG: class I SAM-dependent methyltransferase [Anaerolineae bacterium]
MLPLAQQYEPFAERYSATIESHPFRIYYEKPATLALLPDVRGKDVLDAGCGPGIYSEWLLQHGARVVAVDYAESFVEITRQRVKGAAKVLRADLSQPLTFAADSTFDIVLSTLTFHYIEDWRALFHELHRVLRPGGVVVFTITHPLSTLATERSYFNTELYEMLWTNFGEPYPRINIFRRSLSEMINPIVETGFSIDTIAEPKPVPEYEQVAPEDYAQWSHEPILLGMRVRKP